MRRLLLVLLSLSAGGALLLSCGGGAVCGNGKVETGETCDDGNKADRDGCTSSCQLVCGNGQVDEGEQCDDGNATTGDGCESDCTTTPLTGLCGNGTVDTGEACDDGNRVPADGCENTCRRTLRCGDGVTVAPEQCDDGNTLVGDGCENDCTRTPARCGNGRVENTEQCDDANQVAGDGCENDCSTTVAARCGDGIVNGAEQCDDGNPTAGDGCEPTCTLTRGPSCGNTTVDANEQCDDGNMTPNDGCENNCALTPAATCGNATLDAAEQCDDGNRVSGDGCDSNCAFTVFGAVRGCPGLSLTPPASGTCTVTPGNSSVVVTGVVLGDGVTYLGGQVAWDATGTITCAGCACPSPGATQLVCPRGVVSPGLVNAHDHISFQGNPATATDERYEHRHDWRLGQDGHTRVNNGGNATNAQIRWGELRQLISGTTAIAGATYTTNGNSGLLRNLDTSAAGQLGLNAGAVDTDTFPLSDTNGLELTMGCGYARIPTAASLPATSAYLPHIAEGIEASAQNEFVCLSQANGVGILGSRTAIVHGVGVKAADVSLIAQTGTSLVWSPRSNVSLYGDTASIPLYARNGVNIALGTDWTISGSMNLLRELKCADSLNRERFNRALSDEQLWRSVTVNGAEATALGSKLGRLAATRVADVAIFRRRGTTTHRSVVEAEPDDVVLVVRAGKVLFGDKVLTSAFDTSNGCEDLDVCGAMKQVCLTGELPALPPPATEAANTYASLARANASTYRLFYCGTPMNEPSCVPQRPARNVRNGSTTFTSPAATGDADGDGILEAVDNCPRVFNPARPMDNMVQADADRDGSGDPCDLCPLDANTVVCRMFNPNDRDGDGAANATDNCPADANANQLDSDSDGKGDVCDPCPMSANPGASQCLATIYAIKAPSSPLVGQRVALGDVLVTGANANGFFLQVDPPTAGRDFSGLYAFAPNSGLTQGDRVDIPIALVSNYFGQVQLQNTPAAGDGGIVIRSSGNPVPAPVLVDAAELASNDGGLATRLEGVLVRVENVSVVSISPDAGAGDRAPFNEFVVTGGLRVNDFFFVPTPFPSVGQTFSSITGVLNFRNSNFKIEPRAVTDYGFGPSTVTALEPATAFIREGSSTVIGGPVRVRLSNTESSEVPVTVTASSGLVQVGDGGLIIVAANQVLADVPLFAPGPVVADAGSLPQDGGPGGDGGVDPDAGFPTDAGADADGGFSTLDAGDPDAGLFPDAGVGPGDAGPVSPRFVTLTATKGASSATALLRVLGPTETGTLTGLTPATASAAVGGRVTFTVVFDVPVLQATNVLVTVMPGSLATAPTMVTVPADATRASFDVTAGAVVGTGSVSVNVAGGPVFSAPLAVVAAPTRRNGAARAGGRLRRVHRAVQPHWRGRRPRWLAGRDQVCRGRHVDRAGHLPREHLVAPTAVPAAREQRAQRVHHADERADARLHLERHHRPGRQRQRAAGAHGRSDGRGGGRGGPWADRRRRRGPRADGRRAGARPPGHDAGLGVDRAQGQPGVDGGVDGHRWR